MDLIAKAIELFLPTICSLMLFKMIWDLAAALNASIQGFLNHNPSWVLFILISFGLLIWRLWHHSWCPTEDRADAADEPEHETRDPLYWDPSIPLEGYELFRLRIEMRHSQEEGTRWKNEVEGSRQEVVESNTKIGELKTENGLFKIENGELKEQCEKWQELFRIESGELKEQCEKWQEQPEILRKKLEDMELLLYTRSDELVQADKEVERLKPFEVECQAFRAESYSRKITFKRKARYQRSNDNLNRDLSKMTRRNKNLKHLPYSDNLRSSAEIKKLKKNVLDHTSRPPLRPVRRQLLSRPQRADNLKAPKAAASTRDRTDYKQRSEEVMLQVLDQKDTIAEFSQQCPMQKVNDTEPDTIKNGNCCGDFRAQIATLEASNTSLTFKMEAYEKQSSENQQLLRGQEVELDSNNATISGLRSTKSRQLNTIGELKAALKGTELDFEDLKHRHLKCQPDIVEAQAAAEDISRDLEELKHEHSDDQAKITHAESAARDTGRESEGLRNERSECETVFNQMRSALCDLNGQLESIKQEHSRCQPILELQLVVGRELQDALLQSENKCFAQNSLIEYTAQQWEQRVQETQTVEGNATQEISLLRFRNNTHEQQLRASDRDNQVLSEENEDLKERISRIEEASRETLKATIERNLESNRARVVELNREMRQLLEPEMRAEMDRRNITFKEEQITLLQKKEQELADAHKQITRLQEDQEKVQWTHTKQLNMMNANNNSGISIVIAPEGGFLKAGETVRSRSTRCAHKEKVCRHTYHDLQIEIAAFERDYLMYKRKGGEATRSLRELHDKYQPMASEIEKLKKERDELQDKAQRAKNLNPLERVVTKLQAQINILKAERGREQTKTDTAHSSQLVALTNDPSAARDEAQEMRAKMQSLNEENDELKKDKRSLKGKHRASEEAGREMIPARGLGQTSDSSGVGDGFNSNDIAEAVRRSRQGPTQNEFAGPSRSCYISSEPQAEQPQSNDEQAADAMKAMVADLGDMRVTATESQSPAKRKRSSSFASAPEEGEINEDGTDKTKKKKFCLHNGVRGEAAQKRMENGSEGDLKMDLEDSEAGQ